MEAETTIRALLGTACREAVELFDATACAISRVVGDLLVGLDEHTTSGRPLAHGHEYLISDFPLTREVVDGGVPRWVSRLDPRADEHEATLLSKLGFESLLMVCLPSSGSCWGSSSCTWSTGSSTPSGPSWPRASPRGSECCWNGWSRRSSSEHC